MANTKKKGLHVFLIFVITNIKGIGRPEVQPARLTKDMKILQNQYDTWIKALWRTGKSYKNQYDT